VEQVPAVIYTESADEPGKTLYISPQIEAMTGYTPAEWMNSSNSGTKLSTRMTGMVLHAEDERTNQTGEPFRIEYRISKRDGSVLWIRDEAVLIRGRGRACPLLAGREARYFGQKTGRRGAAGEREALRGTGRAHAGHHLCGFCRPPQDPLLSPQIQQILGFTPAEWTADPGIWRDSSIRMIWRG